MFELPLVVRWPCRLPDEGLFVPSGPVPLVKATTAANVAAEGDGGTGEGESSLSLVVVVLGDWEILRGRPHSKELVKSCFWR